MNQDIRTLLLRLLIGILATIAGIAFRPFWNSEWGIATFIFLAWAAMSIGVGWAGRSQPHSFRFGLIVGSGFASSLIAIALTKSVVIGGGLLIGLVYIGVKTKLFARWGDESGSHPKQ